MANPFKENPFTKLSKPQKYAVIIGSVGIGGYLVIRHHSSTGSWNPWSSGSTSATGSGSAVDPVTGLSYSQDNVVDPITGLTYLAEAQQYGSVQAAESSVSAYGATQNTGSGTAVSPASAQQGGATSTNPYTSNAAWAQAATAGLADIGFPETDVAEALGDYLTETPVTADQAKYISTAIAEYGNPPVGTFQIILQPPTKTGATQATVPEVIGSDLVVAQRNIADAGLRSTANGPKFTAGNGSRIVTRQNPVAQTKVTKGSSVALTYEVKGAGAYGSPGSTPGTVTPIVTGHNP